MSNPFNRALDKAKAPAKKMKPIDVTKGAERAITGIHPSMRRDNPKRK